MSARYYYYLPLLHDAVVSNLLRIIIKKNHPERNIKLMNESEYVLKIDNHEYWWNISIKTTTTVTHNKPDLLVWDIEQKICQIIEFICPCDVNLINEVTEKINTYGPLIRNLKISYPRYRLEMIPIVIGPLGYVVKSLVWYVKQFGFEDKEAIFIIRKLRNQQHQGR